MPSLYVRVSNQTDAWLRGLADETGMSLAAVVQTLLDEARRRGWSVSPRAGQVVEPS